MPPLAEVPAPPAGAPVVASLFSGCGGSSLGYRYAGLRVAYACEFDGFPARTYERNLGLAPDRRDVRSVKGSEVLAACGGRVDVLDGSPPCQPFSTAGKREKAWNRESKHGERQQRGAENLFVEYARLVREVRPAVLVAENVSGLFKGKAKGFFLEALDALRGCGYRVTCRLLDAQWLGVPQQRQRLFFVGVREDLEAEPPFPAPWPFRYSLRDAIGDLVESGIAASYQNVSREPVERDPSLPSTTVTAAGPQEKGSGVIRLEGVQARAKGRNRDGDRPASFVQAYGLDGGARHQTLLSIEQFGGTRGDGAVTTDEGQPSPAVISVGMGGKVLSNVGLRQGPVRRKLTIAEVRRLCSFPDDFELEGSYAQQWRQLGNSVPPLMMRAVARPIRDMLEAIAKRTRA